MANKTKRRSTKATKVRDLPVKADTARQVKGGMLPKGTLKPLSGGVDGESQSGGHEKW